jgi:dihydroflavonol-4-reductase
MVLAAERGRRCERYILSGHNLPYRELFQKVAQIAGTRPIDRPLPRWLAGLLGVGGDLLEAIGRVPLVTSTTVRWGWCQTFQFTCAKAQAELGYAPGPIEPAIADAVTWFRQHDMV